MKIKLQLTVLCLAMAGSLSAQTILGGTTNIGGTTGVQGNAALCQILTTSLPSAPVGASYSQTIATAFCVGTLTFSETGTLPSGLTLNTSTGNISGTIGNNAGPYAFAVTVTDSSSPTPQMATQSYNVSILCTPLSLTGPQTWPVATQGTNYNYTVPASGGIAPVTFAATNLPSAETINSSTGAVTGVPGSVGITSNIGITVTDSCPTGTQTATGTFTEQVVTGLGIVTPPTLPNATTGKPYSAQLTASGGTPPYTNWAVTVGTLPVGLGLNPATGVIAGTPSGTGTSTFTVQVTDSAAGTATLQMTIAVACAPLGVQTQSLPGGTQNSFYQFQEQSMGGFGTVAFSGSSFPSGITINPAGLVSGTPTGFGAFQPSITATDSCPGGAQTASISPLLSIAQQTTGGNSNWTPVTLPAAATQVDSFAINQNNNHWMITDRKAGVFVATNGNAVSPNWTQVNSGLPTNTCGTGGIVCGWTVQWDPHDSSFIICIINAPLAGSTHFYKTTNDGGSWAQIPEPSGFSLSGTIAAGSYDGGLMPPASGGTMLLGGIGCSVANPSCVVMGSTTDGATTFSVATNPAEGKSESFGLNGTTFGLGGEAAGFFTSTDGGHTFNSVWNCGGSVGPSCSSVNDSNEVYTNQRDTTGNWILSTLTGVWRSSGPVTAPTGWTHLYTSSQRSRTLFIDSLGNYYFGQAQQGSNATVRRSTDGGATWPEYDTGIGTGLEAHKFVQNTNDNSIYALIENGTTNAGFLYKIGLTQTVTAPQIQTTSPLPDEVVGQPVNFNMSVAGGVPAYTWASTGSFPPGVSMNAAGAIAGTPSQSGTFTPSIKVTDSEPVTAGPLPFQITVACPAESITTTQLNPANNNTAYQFTMQFSGGVAPLSWGATGLPTGLTINAGTGVISGTPTQSGTFNVAFTLSDSCLPSSTVATVTLPLQVNNPPLGITTTSLPSCTLNQACSDPLNAVGGTPPYTWSISAGGPLQTGLSLTSGVISGTPTASGTVTATYQVTDSASATATTTLPLTVAAASGADNRYCNANETTTGLAADGAAQQLQTCVRTAMADTPSPGSKVTVTAGSGTSLASAIASAVCGTTIVVPALTAPGVQAAYSGNFKPAAACPAGQWITVETDHLSNLPAEGNRVSPAFVGIASLPGRPGYSQPSGGAAIYMPKLITPNTQGTIQTQANASRWRFIGLEITSTAGITIQNPLVSMCGSCNHIILDRSLVHGGNSPTWQDRDTVEVGVRSDGTYNAVIDSYIGDIHCVLNGVCEDNYAIFPGGVTAGPTGPFKAVNDFLEAAGEAMIDGGGGAGTSTQPLQDLEVRRSHLFKPLFWYIADPSYFGTEFDVKNCFELKNANRVLFEGNICDTNFEGQSDQFGELVDIDTKNQASAINGTATSDAAGNITWASGTKFSANQVSSSCAPGGCHFKLGSAAYTVTKFTDTTHITVTPATPATTTATAFTAYLPGLNPNAIVTNLTFRYSLFTHGLRCIGMALVPSDGGDISLGGGNYSLHDIVCDDISTTWANAAGGCCFWMSGFQVQNSFSAPFNFHDIQIRHTTMLAYQNKFTYSNGNGGPSFGFGFTTASGVPNLRIYDNIGTAGWTGSKSPCNTASDSVLNRFKCYDQNNGVQSNTYCFDHNLFATTTQGSAPNNGVTNNAPYPASTDSPGCGFSRTGQTLVGSFAAFQFTNLNGANGGNYLLLNTSPGHNAASDGTDMGANIPLLNQYIAGVQ